MLCLSKCECVSITVHTPLCLSPPFKREAGALTRCGQETMLVSDRGRERQAQERRRELAEASE